MSLAHYCENSQLVQAYSLDGVDRLSRVMGRSWPNGEFAVWLERKKPVQESNSIPARRGKVGDRSEKAGDSPLGSSKVTNYHSESEQPTGRAKRGSKGITSLGKRMVRNACFLLERDVRKDNLSFLTLTLPSAIAQREDIEKRWGSVRRIFFQRLRRWVMRRGINHQVVDVTEVQEKRLIREGGLPLHLHAVFQGRQPGKSWVISTKEVDKLWAETLSCVYNVPVGSLGSSMCNIQRVKKSCAQYLSKYMSKGTATGGDSTSQGEESVSPRYPSSWWGVSQTLKNSVKSQTRYSSKCGETLERFIFSSSLKAIAWSKKIMVTVGDGATLFRGYCGGLTRIGTQLLEQELDRSG